MTTITPATDQQQYTMILLEPLAFSFLATDIDPAATVRVDEQRRLVLPRNLPTLPVAVQHLIHKAGIYLLQQGNRHKLAVIAQQQPETCVDCGENPQFGSYETCAVCAEKRYNESFERLQYAAEIERETR